MKSYSSKLQNKRKNLLNHLVWILLILKQVQQINRNNNNRIKVKSNHKQVYKLSILNQILNKINNNLKVNINLKKSYHHQIHNHKILKIRFRKKAMNLKCCNKFHIKKKKRRIHNMNNHRMKIKYMNKAH